MKIELKNFKSFKDTKIEFKNNPLISIKGENTPSDCSNGAGKLCIQIRDAYLATKRLLGKETK